MKVIKLKFSLTHFTSFEKYENEIKKILILKMIFIWGIISKYRNFILFVVGVSSLEAGQYVAQSDKMQ